MKKGKKDIYLYAGILGIILLVSFLAPWIAPCDPEAIDFAKILAPPSSEHLLGTDDMGRDLFSRILYGGRQSILLAFLATAFSALIGLVIGVAAGYYGGKVDLLITTCSSIFQGLPGTTMMIALTGVLGPGMRSLLIAVIITSWVSFSRIVRGEVMRVKQEYYMESARGLGAGNMRLLCRHILPNIMESIIVLFTNKIGSVVLSVASLSYLGFGLQPPTPDWGIMIKEARTYFRSAPLMAIAPGICIILFVFFFHSIGNWLIDCLVVRIETSFLVLFFMGDNIVFCFFFFVEV